MVLQFHHLAEKTWVRWASNGLKKYPAADVGFTTFSKKNEMERVFQD
jgi:hypothetical protein